MKKAFILLTLATMVFAGCTAKAPEKEQTSTSTTTITQQESEAIQVSYNKISPEDGKKMMQQNAAIILVDVRMEEEFAEGHIEGAILIPDVELQERAPQELPDKDATIIVYCRSGRRSQNSAMDLISMGYTNVYDMGGILSWPYDIVK